MNLAKKSVDTIRVLSAEAIEKAKSGHPGICLGAAAIGYELFADFLNFSYKNPHWHNRDRFVLSAGHGSMLLYSLLHIFGYNVKKEDIENFRQFGSITPGHPEYGVTDGVETSTGPLGQGIGNAVGFAVAEAHLGAMFNRPDYEIVDHFTYVLCGDGCLEEGISYEACSFAGTQKLGKLILLYDKNNITIEGNINTTFTEETATRFAAQGWQVLRVSDANNVALLKAALNRAKSDLTRPSIIICNSVIGYGSAFAGTANAHGSPLGEENLQKLKDSLEWTQEPFTAPDDVKAHCLKLADEKLKAEQEWNELFARYSEEYPELAEKFKKFMSGSDPDFGDLNEIFNFPKPEATRVSGGKVLNRLAGNIPNLMVGSADLSPSTKTELKGKGFFSPDSREGCNIRFGIREHAMAAICNGIQLHGGLRAVCSTFFTFSDYMRGAVRMSAIMDIPVTYVFTHDSIGVGEDGPTHQPVEHLIALRAMPDLKVFRPCDGKETAAAFMSAFTSNHPTAIVLSRQDVPQYTSTGLTAMTGGYTVSDFDDEPDVLLISTGAEVELCVGAQELLAQEGIKARIVSMPCIEEFENQTDEYKAHVLPPHIKARVCIEAGSHYSWYKYAGDKGEIIAMHTFGKSGKAETLFEHFGFTKENIAEKAKASMSKVAQE